MQKRGELTSGQIATLILAIAGFIIAVIFLLVILDTKTLSERETCHLSVLTRATTPDALQRLVPLKCKTQKICLTTSSDNCEDQFAGEKNVQSIKVQTHEDIEREVAYNMYDCWTMMGEGKLDVFGDRNGAILKNLDWSQVVNEKASTCMICSRLVLSKDILANTQLLNSIDVNSYMETHQVPGSELTYLQAFTDAQVRSYPQKFRENFIADKDVIPTNEIAIVFMQILTSATPVEEGTSAALTGAGFVFAATTVVGPLGRMLGWKLTALVAAGTAATAGTIEAVKSWNSRQVSAGYCGPFTSESEARKGCSIVTPFNYKKVSDINNFCAKIEGQL